MGVLKNFDLRQFPNVHCFVETGTQEGHGVDHVLKYNNFISINSVEINKDYYNFCLEKYKNNQKVNLWFGSSESKMTDILKSIEKFDQCLFWLDAHLPTDPGSKFTYEDEKSEEIEFPLEKELNIIYEARKDKKDIFIIDDLRIYIDGDFQYPIHTWEHKNKYPNFFPYKNGIKFIENLYGKTHQIIKIFDHEGYLLLKPNDE